MEMCVFSSLLTLLCVGLCGSSTYAEVCMKPILNPEFLEVEYGHSAEVNCSILNKPETEYLLGWESKSSQPMTDNETSVMWKVHSLTIWEEVTGINCYFTGSDHQCQTNVTLTIYKRPDSVKLNSPVWVEGVETELECEILNVGPGRILSVVWSRADPKQSTFTQLNTSFPDLGSEMKNVNSTVKLNITPTREDDGAQYRCEALLNLNKPLVTPSEPITITVLYKPTIKSLTSDEGKSLTMNCLADGNPSPQFNWTLPNNTIISNSSSSISITRVAGQYICTAYNAVGHNTEKITIDEKQNYYWFLLVLIVPVVLGFVAFKYYRNRRVGQYILKRLRVNQANQNHETSTVGS